MEGDFPSDKDGLVIWLIALPLVYAMRHRSWPLIMDISSYPSLLDSCMFIAMAAPPPR